MSIAHFIEFGVEGIGRNVEGWNFHREPKYRSAACCHGEPGDAIKINSRSRNNFLAAMPESPSKGSKPVLKSRYNALSSHSTVPSSRPSTVPANDHEAVAPLLIEKGANREGKDSRDRTTRATIEQPSRNPSSTIRKVIPFAIILLSSFAQVLCAIVIGQYDALHTRSGLSAPLNLIGILCWQKSALSVNYSLYSLDAINHRTKSK